MAELKEKLVYSVAEAAEVLDVSVTTMYEMIHIKGFPSVPVGKRRWKVSKAGLAAWVEKQAARDGREVFE